MRIRMVLDRLRHGEEGIAIPLVMIVTSIGFAFVSVALVSSVNAQQGTMRDQDSKVAQGAADAAANLALLRSNRYLRGAAQCVYPSTSGVSAPLTTGTSTSGWCPAVSGTVGGATWTYQQSSALSATGAGQPTTIVATGTSDGVTRRVAVTVRPESGASILAEERVATMDYLTLSGNPNIYVNTGTNGDVTMSGSSGVCGHIRHGVGDDVTGTNRCPGYEIYEGDKNLPPLSAAALASLRASNRNCQIARTCSPAASYSKNGSFWDPATRTIDIGQNATLTLPTGDYLICRFNGGNGSLVMPTGAVVRLFFDTPENCGLPADSLQVETGGNFNIESTGFNPQTNTGALPGFYLFGSPTVPTRADFGGGSSANEFVFYGPYTNVEMRGNVEYVGAFGAKGITMHGNPTIRSFANLDLSSIPTELTWRRDRYIECTPGSNPALGC